MDRAIEAGSKGGGSGEAGSGEAGSGEAGSIEARLAAVGLPPLPRTAWAEIDLDALAGNLAVIRRLAGAGVPVQPVVKADAYGHGALPIALALARAGADGFCVATFDEAVDLREGGVELPLLVLYPIPPALAREAASLRIAVTAGDEQLLRALLAAVGSSGAATAPLELQLEVETGLGRGGFAVDEIVGAARAIVATAGATLAGLWTHLQAAEHPARTAAQQARFESAVAALQAAGIPLPPRHLAASSGLLQDGVATYDGVRSGLATYGLVPDELLDGGGPVAGVPPDAAGLRPILSLRARPVRVADVPADWGISYGPTFTTTRPSRIATLPLGYGDGWPRSLSNRAAALVRGRRVPLVGNVAMDAVMADVTDVPGPPVTVADEFVLIGEQGDERITAADLAAARGTNSWEVVTGLAARLPRVYHAASAPRELRTLTGHVRAGDGAGGGAGPRDRRSTRP
ncbi:MAG TPA: alanine racemase [Candidatus Binatia bacterium]|nr:alanine racemase [Candidatus Binatia bacterium]